MLKINLLGNARPIPEWEPYYQDETRRIVSLLVFIFVGVAIIVLSVVK